MSGFRPQLWPTLFTLVVVLVCGGLGVWQLERLQWKRALIAQRDAALTAPPAALPHDPAEGRRLEFRRVAADGVLLHDKELYLNAIGPRGGAGFDVLTPLRAADGSTVLVDRGFVPSELHDPARRPDSEPSGPRRIEGVLRLPPPAKPGWFVPDNRPERNSWFWVDLPAMAASTGLSNLAPFYIQADASAASGAWPKPRPLPAVPNDHLQYAITWFSLAAAALVIYVLSQRRRPPQDPNDDRLSGA